MLVNYNNPGEGLNKHSWKVNRITQGKEEVKSESWYITCLVTEEQQEMDRISSQTGDHQQQNTVKNTNKVEEKN